MTGALAGIKSGIRDGAFSGGPVAWTESGDVNGVPTSPTSPTITDWDGGSLTRRTSNVSSGSVGFSGPADQHPLADDLRADFSNPLAGGNMDGFSGW